MLAIYIVFLALLGFGFIYNLFLALEYLHKNILRSYKRCRNISIVFFVTMIIYSIFVIFATVGMSF